MIRVRYAPSPTGDLHVGGARTLLFNWLFARRHGGKIILRIDDTDRERGSEAFETRILEDIDSLGLGFDEGPREGGGYGPYRQSERQSLYEERARELLERGLAYPCFCREAELTRKRELALKLGRPPVYDGTCARLDSRETEVRVRAGETAGIRFRAPGRDLALRDLVRGEIPFPAGTVGDFYLTRSASDGKIGVPVYNFSCAIDDHLMGISHVIRGDDHLANTARQLMILEAFGWETPKYAHLAMVLGADRQKLSKRNGDSAVREYLDQGFLPEALLGILALVGWTPTSTPLPGSAHPEVFTLEELVARFDLAELHRSAGVFDQAKLKWMNGFCLKKMPADELARRLSPALAREGWRDPPWAARPGWRIELADALRGEGQTLVELAKAAAAFGESAFAPDEQAREALREGGEVARALIEAIDLEPEPWNGEGRLLDRVSSATGKKGKALFFPVRAALTGRVHGPELKRVLALLGRQECARRARESLKAARGTSIT